MTRRMIDRVHRTCKRLHSFRPQVGWPYLSNGHCTLLDKKLHILVRMSFPKEVSQET